ncbi:MAG TPA: alpha-2-macroglobulin family protein, partial [Pedobacter sp.]
FSIPSRLLANHDNFNIKIPESKQNNSPLYVIDGVPHEGTQLLKSLNPSEILSMEILKDAKSLNKYGSRASNGVVLITTNSGSSINEPDVAGINAFRFPVQLSNLNHQQLDGNLKVRIYSLASAEQVFVKRLWNSPDKPLMSKEDFIRLFPYYEFAGEGNFKNWKRNKLISESDLKVSANAVNSVDLSVLKRQLSGTYEIELFAKNAKGDTITSKYYTSLISEPSVPERIEDWVVPAKTTVFPGEDAEFFVGLNKGSNILMETYDGVKLLSSEWIKSGAKQQHIKVPVNLGSTNFAVQFLTVFQNRLMSSHHRITFRAFNNKLDVRFLTFRDKLEPDSKEQWKLQIKGSDNQAEMVASLYDSSLDEVAGPQNWLSTLNSSYTYQPSYFNWLEHFVSSSYGSSFAQTDHYYVLDSRNYETLDMLGFNYYGGYNSGYHSFKSRIATNVYDRKLKEEYHKNAALVKDGFDVSGIVADQSGHGLPGATVQIKGTNIKILTNSQGYFVLKVPQRAILRVSYIGFRPKEIAAKSPVINVILASENVLNNVVVTGYGTQRKREITGTAVQEVRVIEDLKLESSGAPGGAVNVRIRGTTSVTEDNAVYSVASIDLNAAPKPRTNIPRKNFNETAFFYPHLRTNSKGEILIEFTIPEALTSWRFRGFAHTKSLSTGYIEKTIVTQKSLMIAANMPRFLREGDSITISARVTNLSEKKLNGQIELQLFDALNMKPLNLFASPANAKQNFNLAAATNKAVSFSLIIPKGLDAVTYRLTADASNFQDGEENTIAVLPNSMLVTESLPMMVRGSQTKTFTLDKLKNVSSTTLKHKTVTLEYTQNPVWYAVQSLPYLMEYPYECSEHIFSRYFANSLAGSIVNRLPQIKKVFDRWKMTNSDQLLSNLEKNSELKSILLEETPWLRNAASESEQKKRIALLFDLNKMGNDLEADISKLGKMQRHDGGFPWFAGSNYSDRYITQHILGGFGQLGKLTETKSGGDVKAIVSKALIFLDNEIIRDYTTAVNREKKSKKDVSQLSAVTLHALYVRSYYPVQKISPGLKAAMNYFMPKIYSGWKFRSVYEQGLMAFVLKRNNQPETAKAIIRSLKETAQQSEELGMYWAKNQLGYYWYQSPIETQALMIELFSEVGNEQVSVEEMKIWLLRNKQTNNWRTTKATALACHALLLRGSNTLEASAETEISLGGQALAVLKPDIKSDAGTGYIKTTWSNEQIKPELANVRVQNTGKAISWGALHWQYLEELNKITPAETQLKLERKYFIQRQTDAGPRLTEINNSNLPKTGDLLKVVVYLNADRDYEYVQLKDMRPSGTEPSDILSGYKYQDRIYYYQVTKDVATNFFINYLPKGKYLFEYNLRVAQPGNYSTGISSIQCLYAPEFNAHSEGLRMTIK